jgi:signal transduction histidine kinase
MLISRPNLIRLTAIGTAGGAILLTLQPKILQYMFDTEGFEPHGHCFLWIPSILNMYAISDTFIGLSYMVISSMLLYLIYRVRQYARFQYIFIAFGAFIFFCGLTHFMDVWMLWQPVYWLGGFIRIATALASVGTAMLMPPLIPRVLALVEANQRAEERRLRLIEAHENLQTEIADRRRAENELRVAFERERRLSEYRREFVMRMSHEFRTPLSTAMLAGEMLERYDDRLSAEQRTDRLQQIQDQLQHLTALLNDILTIDDVETQQMAFNPTTIDLRDICKTTIETMTTTIGNDHTLSFQATGNCSEIQADERLIQQVLNNLLSNAIKYSPVGENIDLHLRCEDTGVTIQIKDNGIGIHADDLPQVFEAFYRGRNIDNLPGTGLGLAIVRQIVNLHGGTVVIESAPKQGTMVTIKLPTTVPQKVMLGASPP